MSEEEKLADELFDLYNKTMAPIGGGIYRNVNYKHRPINEFNPFKIYGDALYADFCITELCGPMGRVVTL